MSFVQDLALLATAWSHVFLAPYTKVEESFNLHAVHDVLMYGIGPDAVQNYDHKIFPGAVPRTFIGSVLLAWVSAPVIKIAAALELIDSKTDLQIIVRLVLATINAFGLILVRRAVSRWLGRLTGLLWTLLTCTQFHLPFWMGRTLPNMLALFPANVALSFLIPNSPARASPTQPRLLAAISLLVFTGVVFRSEVSLLLAPIAIHAMVLVVPPVRLIKTGIISATLSIGLTILVDSYFWGQYLLWPELYGVYFNVYQGKSSEWGVSPIHTYFTVHMPKLLLSSTFLAAIGFLADTRLDAPVVQALSFVMCLSFLGHKEWRFIIYVVPLLNVAAARGARALVSRPKGTLFGRLCFASFVMMLFANSLCALIYTYGSMENYPGGVSLARFNEYYKNVDNVHVHISNLAAQTGASLFLQTRSAPYHPSLPSPYSGLNWTYNKTEDLTTYSPSRFTHLIAEASEPVPWGWKKVDCVEGFDRWSLVSGVLLNPKKNVGTGDLGTLLRVPRQILTREMSDKLCILERS
ncbi:alpha-1,6-mannosyltransferase subunit [Thelephora ganbajun]|uniref:Alpha-1,6-mannosyltransferase subunit n=1 Tax=Thelephora ganbajun TaxID=370292 RepID=A0ACB6ZJE9_THEGA|nr:alpha-1,6-mannosyltransferase subunit [Thelephora ganbajun]